MLYLGRPKIRKLCAN